MVPINHFLYLLQQGVAALLLAVTLCSSAFALTFTSSLDQCSVQLAECGAVRTASGESINCGSCEAGQSCSANRCESICSLDQIDVGPHDDLLVYVPNQLTASDQSPYQHDVTNTYRSSTTEENKDFPFTSRTDFTDQSLSIDLAGHTAATPLTVALKLIPNNTSQRETILSSNALTISQQQGSITSTLAGAVTYNLNNQNSVLKTRSCNQYALVINNDQATSYFNGNSETHAIDAAKIETLAGDLKLEYFPGKIWDIRVYQRALDADEIKKLGENCDDDQVRATPHEGYPNYLCSVYQCIWWPDGITDTSYESFQYQVNAHDMTWEHNVLATGMYKHDQLCSEYAKPRDLKLDEGYRKSWVSKFSYENPWGNYVLHENFHAYQNRAGGGAKFLLESTANWGAYTQKPGDDGVKLLAMYTLQPHLPLYADQSSPIEEGIIDAYKGGHQYGAGIFEYYLSTYIASQKLIGDAFNDASNRSQPVAAMYKLVQQAGVDMRDVFSEFAARTVTWDYPSYGEEYRKAEIASYGRMVSQNNGPNGDKNPPWPTDEIDNKISAFYDTAGTGEQWATVPARYKPGNWAYNVYQVDVTDNELYNVSLRTSTDNAAHAEFRAQVVVYNEPTQQRTYHLLNVAAAGMESSIKVAANAGDKLFLVVASTPSTVFKGWDTYTYDYQIQAGATPDDGNGDGDGDSDGDGDGDGDNTTPPWWKKLLTWFQNFIDWLNSLRGDSDSNNAPVASTGNFTGNQDNLVALQLSASDSENDTLTYSITQQPSHGTLMGTLPNVVYQPNAGFYGTDSLSFKANDGKKDSNIATIAITINPLANNTPKAKVYLMAGQSNMVGHGSNSALSGIDASLNIARDDVFIKSIISPNRAMSELKPGYGYNSGTFGVELKFGHVLGDTLDDNIYLFKASQGGTTLDNTEHWRPLAFGGTDNNLYDQMMKGFKSFLTTELADIEHEVAGFVWFQGYNDTFGTENNYEDHLRNLLVAVRSDLNLPELPVIIVQINDNRGAAGEIVRTAQSNVALESDLNSLVVTGDQRPYYHYGSDSYVVIGDRIAQAALPSLGIPSSVADEFTIAPDGSLNQAANKGVLKNDVGTSLTAELVRQPVHGNFQLNSNGGFIYTPDSGYKGQDSFLYRAVSNGMKGNTSKVKLWVRDANNPLAMHFSFDNQNENDIIDESSGIKAAIVKAGVTFGHAGKQGYAAHFNGEGIVHYLTHYPVVDFLNLSTDEDFSFALWIKPDGTAAEEQILVTNKYYYGRDSGFAFTTSANGKSIHAYIGALNHADHKTNRVNFSANQGVIDDGNWHHVAFSASFSTEKLTLFVDGIQVGETSLAGISGDINKYESAIGDGSGGGDGNSKAFNGYMDELMFFRKALSAEEIQQLMQ